MIDDKSHVLPSVCQILSLGSLTSSCSISFLIFFFETTYISFIIYVFPVTSRDEIAGCSEKAYDYLSISDARQMLLFSSDKELLEYVKEVSSGWCI